MQHECEREAAARRGAAATSVQATCRAHIARQRVRLLRLRANERYFDQMRATLQGEAARTIQAAARARARPAVCALVDDANVRAHASPPLSDPPARPPPSHGPVGVQPCVRAYARDAREGGAWTKAASQERRSRA
eukprot:6195472-Pleurochrysis_carterae.AAC.4